MKIRNNSKEGKTRILLVDDHPLVRQGLAQMINHERDLIVCAEAETAAAGLKAIPVYKPDLAIVDLSLKGVPGIELIKDLQVQHPVLPVLVLTMHDNSLYAERALRAGARGFITKQEAPNIVITAIRSVLRGEIYLSDPMRSHLLRPLVGNRGDISTSPIERLSDRELEVFELLGNGRSTREIASTLRLSVKTIETYREHIKTKLALKNSNELVQRAAQWVDSSRSSPLV